MQAYSLEQKIQIAQTRILEWFIRFNGNVYVAFSGGKDSSVLLDLARRVDSDIPAVFVDTSLEYPENREFVRTKDNVIWLKPKKSFREILDKYGYPVISKEIANCIEGARNGQHHRLARLNGENVDKNGKPSRFNCANYRYLLDAPFKISDKCCYHMKKAPVYKYERETGRHSMLGTMASESRLRQQSWVKNGCNAFNVKRPVSRPLSIWTEQDILRYLLEFKLPYSPVYGEIVSVEGKSNRDGTPYLTTTGVKRSGCMFCMFGVHLESVPNRFQLMKYSHPKLYDYCIDKLGCGNVLDYIGVPY